MAVHHRRAGKDLMAMHTMAMLMLRRVGMYWHVFPTFEQGRKAIWEGFRKDGKRTDRNRDSASAPCPINAVAGSNVGREVNHDSAKHMACVRIGAWPPSQ